MRDKGNVVARVLNQFAWFAGVGIVGTFAHYLLLIILVQLLGVRAVFASIAGFLVGACINYYLNHRITFRSATRHREGMRRVFIVALVGLVLNSSLMTLATEVVRLHYLLSQVLATGAVLLWTFSGNRLWTFAD